MSTFHSEAGRAMGSLIEGLPNIARDVMIALGCLAFLVLGLAMAAAVFFWMWWTK